jgi:hypothetical protein
MCWECPSSHTSYTIFKRYHVAFLFIHNTFLQSKFRLQTSFRLYYRLNLDSFNTEFVERGNFGMLKFENKFILAKMGSKFDFLFDLGSLLQTKF